MGEIERSTARWHSADFVDDWIHKREQHALYRRHRDMEFERLAASLSFAPAADLEFLDLGAGWGRTACSLAQRFPRARVVALDFSEPMLERARQRSADLGTRVEVVHADLNAAGALDAFGRERFHAVFALQALHHLAPERLRPMLAEIHAALRPGGVFLNLDRVRPSPIRAVRLAQRVARVRWPGESRWTVRRWDRPRLLDRIAVGLDRRLGAGPDAASELQLGEQLEQLASVGFDTDWETLPSGPILFCARKRPAAG